MMISFPFHYMETHNKLNKSIINSPCEKSAYTAKMSFNEGSKFTAKQGGDSAILAFS